MLRALQEHKISRVGSDKDIAVDVRVVAATNKDLKAPLLQGNSGRSVPSTCGGSHPRSSLADRADDIPLLVAHFLETLVRPGGSSDAQGGTSAMDMLVKAPWTGNVRELRNAVERLLIFCPQGGSIDKALVDRFGHIS